MFKEAEASGDLPRLGQGDVIAFLSGSRDQLVFVSPPYEHLTNGRTVKLYASRRLRISSGSWNPLMLENYAQEVGLSLVGLKTFEEHYNRMREEKRAAPPVNGGK
jgi:hypothetical protein